MSNGKWSYTYISAVKRLIRAGYDTDQDFAEMFDVTVATIREWRKKYWKFDRAIRTERKLYGAELSERMQEFSRNGSESATRFLLERRHADVWQPTSKIDHTSNGKTLSALLSEHKQLDMDDLERRGLISYEDDEARLSADKHRRDDSGSDS